MTPFAPIEALGVRTTLAIVAPNDLAYGVGRRYETRRGEDAPEEVQVVRSMDDARRWVAPPWSRRPLARAPSRVAAYQP